MLNGHPQKKIEGLPTGQFLSMLTLQVLTCLDN